MSEQFKTIRVKRRGTLDECAEAELLEYHPDHSAAFKFRGRGYVRSDVVAQDWPEDVQERNGIKFVAVREFLIHELDRHELNNYSVKHLNYGPILISPLPSPLQGRDKEVLND